MDEIVLNVTGMSCGSCIRRVNAALSEVPGVCHVDVDLRAKQVRVHPNGALDVGALTAALARAGYSATPR